jgi:hypothetical protein
MLIFNNIWLCIYVGFASTSRSGGIESPWCVAFESLQIG